MNGRPHSFKRKPLSVFKESLGGYFFLLTAINKPMTVNTIIRISYASIGYLLHRHKEESGSNASRYPSENMRGQPSTVYGSAICNIA